MNSYRLTSRAWGAKLMKQASIYIMHSKYYMGCRRRQNSQLPGDTILGPILPAWFNFTWSLNVLRNLSLKLLAYPMSQFVGEFFLLISKYTPLFVVVCPFKIRFCERTIQALAQRRQWVLTSRITALVFLISTITAERSEEVTFSIFFHPYIVFSYDSWQLIQPG